MKEQIEAIFKGYEELPLFYVESGSRLWGIESPDSDFDVRGFHLQSKRQYFDFKTHRDIIEFIDGDFDFVSYDIDKMFGLLSKSNPTVFEWIRAHIIYFNNLPNWLELQRDIITNFDFKALFHHYISLAKGNINLMGTGKKFTYKTTFYCIRGLLSADLATKQIIPELLIDDLFNQFDKGNDVLTIAKESLERKKEKTEKEVVEIKQQGHILTKIKTFVTDLEGRVPKTMNNRERLETILTNYSNEIKSLQYSNR
jgi:predicted nucleotidyltransferase